MSSAPKLQRLDHWTLVAKDLERTRTFYTEVLGATVLKRDGGPAAVVLANTIIDFFPANGESQPSPGAGQQHHA